MSLKGTPILGLQIVILLAIVGGRVVGQNSGDDTMCLTGFKASLQDNGGALAQWTPVQLASPCNTSAAPLNGIVCQNDRINSINLRGTNLMGSISPSLANCSNLQTLDLSANQLSGPIPTNLGNLSYLTTLNFSKNQLTGFIPLELSACIYLNVIDLHQNQLTGAIPAQLGYLSRLKAFDVSDNQLSGPVPTTLSNTSNGSPRFNSTSFLGNKGLYGYPLPPLKTHNLSVLAILGIGLGSGLVSLVVSFTAVCIWLRVTEQGYAAEEGKISQLMSES